MTEFHPTYLLNAVAYAAVGVLLFVLAFLMLDRMIPQGLRREYSRVLRRLVHRLYRTQKDVILLKA